ncbi:Hpt domain-containing protein [Pseudarthrobacter equi]|uniref:Hpt domain-containing protein n=1 Tax=Pseudarthrobacter equi TaxID=728066 RepID=UPI0021C03D90|nr:Hpt domain-containing protein [Pseudarthrobacter equi]MCT9625613.1 Hpt domain-containing protein [Pseudarthrobacter equi]
MNAEDDHKLPLLDSSVLSGLRAGKDTGYGIWRVFIDDFITQLPARIQTLRSALTTGDIMGGINAALALRTSVQMVGGLRLAALTLTLEGELRRVAAEPDPASVLPGLAVMHLNGILHCAQRTIHTLEAALE